MNKILTAFFILLTSLGGVNAQNEKLDKLFQEFEKSGGVTSINIKKPMFNLLRSLNLNDEYLGKIKPIMSQVEGIKMLVIPKASYPEHLKEDNKENTKLNLQKLNRVNDALKSLQFNELMTINREGTAMRFLAEKEKGDFLENLVFNIDSKEENIIFLLNGKMKMSDVNKMVNSESSIFVPLANSSKKESQDSYLSGEARQVADFSGVDVRMGINVVFKQENQKSVKVIADADKLKYIITKVENGILNVYIDNKGEKNLKFKNLSVIISNPDISIVKASSGGNFTAGNTINTPNLTFDVSSGSSVNGDFKVKNSSEIKISSGAGVKIKLQADRVKLNASSGSSSKIEGSASVLEFDVSSGASVKMIDFIVQEAEGEATSGSVISMNVNNKLKVKASSGGVVKYKGNPTIDSKINKISGGLLSKIN